MAQVRIPTPLRKFTQGKEEVTVAGANVPGTIVLANYRGLGQYYVGVVTAVRRHPQQRAALRGHHGRGYERVLDPLRT